MKIVLVKIELTLALKASLGQRLCSDENYQTLKRIRT